MLAGDLVDGREVHTGPLLAPVADLDAPLGGFAVSGNHEVESGDGAAYLDRFEGVGLTVLRNEAVRIRRGGDEVVVAGVHDAIGTGALAPDVDAALADVDADDFVIFVAHQPLQVPDGDRVDLQLSGHTHGGQIWPFGWLVPLQQPTLAGVDDVYGVAVVTSRGFGTSGPPVRVGSPPDIVVLTLRSAARAVE